MEEDDDIPQLNASTMAALQEFLREKQEVEDQEQGDYGMVQEDWRMSQFWYEPSTSKAVADEIHLLSQAQGAIACIACPSLYTQLKRSYPNLHVRLLEYDDRFSKFGEDFVLYDYNRPTDLPLELRESFEIVVADPPYLSRECLEKTVETMRFLSRDMEKLPLLVLTGATQREHVWELLKARPCGFRPLHTNKLGNEFMLFTSYDPQERLGGWEEDG